MAKRREARPRTMIGPAAPSISSPGGQARTADLRKAESRMVLPSAETTTAISG